MTLAVILWLVASGGFVMGMMFGFWLKGNDHAWNGAMAELEREIASDKLAEAKELRRAALLHHIANCERQAENGKSY